MDRQQKIDVLQKELSRKDLTFGCLFRIKEDILNGYAREHYRKFDTNCICTSSGFKEWEDIEFNFIGTPRGIQYWTKDIDGKSYQVKQEKINIYDIFTQYNYDSYESKLDDFIKILGHPVILSDVLVWLGNNDVYYHFDGVIRILSRPLNYIDRDLTKPYLSEQSDEVISGLYEVYLLTKKD